MGEGRAVKILRIKQQESRAWLFIAEQSLTQKAESWAFPVRAGSTSYRIETLGAGPGIDQQADPSIGKPRNKPRSLKNFLNY